MLSNFKKKNGKKLCKGEKVALEQLEDLSWYQLGGDVPSFYELSRSGARFPLSGPVSTHSLPKDDRGIKKHWNQSKGKLHFINTEGNIELILSVVYAKEPLCITRTKIWLYSFILHDECGYQAEKGMIWCEKGCLTGNIIQSPSLTPMPGLFLSDLLLEEEEEEEDPFNGDLFFLDTFPFGTIDDVKQPIAFAIQVAPFEPECSNFPSHFSQDAEGSFSEDVLNWLF